MTNKTGAALAALDIARTLVPVASQWQHFKGGLYEVVGHALDTDNGKVRVRYHRLAGPNFNAFKERGIDYVRCIDEWTPDRFSPHPAAYSDARNWLCTFCGNRKSDGCGGPDRLVEVEFEDGPKLVRPACPLEYRPPLTSFFDEIIQLFRRKPG